MSSDAGDGELAGAPAADRARFEQLVRSGPTVLYSLRAEPPYDLTYVSDNVTAFCGFTPQQLLADPGLFASRLHPGDAERVYANAARLPELGRSVIEYRFRRADGHWAWTRDEQVVVRDGSGRSVEVIGSLLDITDRKRSEERSARMQELTGALATALTPAQVADAALGPTLAVLEASGGALMLLDAAEPGDPAGVPMLRVIGATGFRPDVATEWSRFPADLQTPAGEALITRRPVYVGSEEEGTGRYPEMFAAPPDRRLSRSWAALPLQAGDDTVGVLALGFAAERFLSESDRSFLGIVAAQCGLALERSRLYERAATQREQLTAVLAQLPAGVIIGEAPSGRLVLGNDEVERIWRHPFLRSASVGDYADYRGFHPGSGRPYEPAEWPLARSLLTGEVVSDEEIDILRGDATRGTIVVNSAPIRGADGRVTAAVTTFLDITERAEYRRRTDAAYAAEQAARAAAEAAWSRLDRLQKITVGLSEAVTPEQVGTVMVQGGLSVLGCASAWIGVLDESGQALTALAASFPVEPDGPAARIPLDAASPRAEVTRTGTPVWLPSTADALQRYPGLRAVGIAQGALGVVPLVSHGRPIGAMALSFVESRELEPEERALVVTLAEQCAQALERARLHQHEHDVALTLQHSMLPSALPSVSGLDLAARYRSAEESLDVGGDWYDVLTLSDGKVGLAVGDVVGRGLGAATTMGQLRSALAAVALCADSPAAVLDGLERFARQVDGARLATVVYGVLDPVTGELRYACAGHPPPLLLQPGGQPALLEAGRSPLLCALPPELTSPRTGAAVRLRPGAVLVLYSDGLVERRGEPLDVGLDRLLVRTNGLPHRGLADWSDALVDGMLADGKGDDDVALLAVRYAPELIVRLPARADRLAELRRRLRTWLHGVGATPDEVADLLVACGEACANAVEHAYADGPGDLTVRLQLEEERQLTVTVADRGRWRAVPAAGDRGRGLPLMRALTDDMDVESGDGGTVVTLRRRLGTAA